MFGLVSAVNTIFMDAPPPTPDEVKAATLANSVASMRFKYEPRRFISYRAQKN